MQEIVLHFAADKDRKKNKSVMPVTFNQPLYGKDFGDILSSENSSYLDNVFLRLSGFHLLCHLWAPLGTPWLVVDWGKYGRLYVMV